uniref:Sushi domain-containing protein n=1 Tax=Pelusios castaneus TaxID=367368 RepID=A0A8C8SKI9_9SAUR
HVLSTLQRLQKLLAGQELAGGPTHRTMPWGSGLLQPLPDAGCSGSLLTPLPLPSEICPHLATPLHGRKLGKQVAVGHEVHFLCDAGFQLLGSKSRTCLQNRTWSGQQPVCHSSVTLTWVRLSLPVHGQNKSHLSATADWVTLNNSSSSRQPRCTDTRLGSRHCTCDTGFQLSASGMCQDVDECQLFQSSWQTRICVHNCVNLPGSYRCVCPEGYLMHTDQNSCNDVDECTNRQHNCSRAELCINVFGGYRCMHPECPKPRLNTSYVRTSKYQCERNPCPMDSTVCRLAANSVSFHYLPLQSNLTMPRVLFKMSTRRLVGDSLRFAITGGSNQGVFAVARSARHTGELILTSPVVGPATLQVELEMSQLAQKVLLGKHVFKVMTFISQYEF